MIGIILYEVDRTNRSDELFGNITVTTRLCGDTFSRPTFDSLGTDANGLTCLGKVSVDDAIHRNLLPNSSLPFKGGLT
ncbi:hypothetical protein D3C84_356300 [compost metagenome]